MLHPWTELRPVSPDIGRGVFATRAIPRGTLLWVLCERERIYAPAEVARLAAPEREAVERLGYIDPRGDVVLCCDEARYMNHSCRPAALPVGPDADVAVRDLRAGDEITCEYATLNLTGLLRCRCGLPDCRGLVGGDDLAASDRWREWDRLVQEAVEHARRVPQPLLSFARDRDRLTAVVAGAGAVPSVRCCLPSRGRPARHGRGARRRAPAAAGPEVSA
jgi:hypothetical protein